MCVCRAAIKICVCLQSEISGCLLNTRVKKVRNSYERQLFF